MTRALALTLLAVAFVAACSRQEPELPPFDAKVALDAYLGSIYGTAVAHDKAWTDGADDARVQRKVCAFGTTEGATRGRYLLAVCGESPEVGHAAPGLIDFHVLEPTPRGFHAVEFARDHGFGSDGHPGVVSLVRLGRDRAGFEVTESWTGQGTSLGTRSVHEFRDGTLQPLATLRSAISNMGASNCAKDAPCATLGFDLSFALSFDNSQPDVDAYPLTVHETGYECGSWVDRRHRFVFDAALGRYPVPATLMREDCLQHSNPVSGVASP